ncbi:Glycosidase [Quadrisphaera granulorum]|uniref:Glycosidase n=1 Tax=Quadrisphaera granulorum TaxID=317664 RepID=A0A316AFN2_9ACTN|nr:alpha-amylase family glycosyl hydrolase [Quadrisphaera granulorum]PWJ56421.1 glycosidase [Quadrisphaera granulorum]SZE95055.1 Glycosidase [Quadrisphaera granulorum]
MNPSWSTDTVWWHVYPLGACGAPIHDAADRPDAAAPRLLRLLPWLDHAAELGCTGLLLGPMNASSTHGYDVVDHFRLDPRLGGADRHEADRVFDQLVTACRERGLRLALDAVLSHVGREHPLVRDLRSGMVDVDPATLDAPDGPRPRVFEGHDALVRLAHGDPRVRDLAVDVLSHWLDRGVDAWRLDAAYSIDPAFWAEVLPRVRERHPRAWFLGEVIHGDHPAVVEATTIDSLTQYELWKATWSAVLDRNLFELDWTLKRHESWVTAAASQPGGAGLPQTFVGNHDVTRIASRVGHDGALVAAVVLLTTAGVPSIYAGDEWGATGTKEDRAGGDDAVRPALPDSPAALDLDDDGRRILAAHRELLALRRARPWLTTARTTTTSLENQHMTYRSDDRSGGSADDRAVLVELDLRGTPRAVVRDDGGRVLWAG